MFTNNELNSITKTEQLVRDVLDNFNVTKACGSDLISPRLLKEGVSVLSKPLAMVFIAHYNKVISPPLGKTLTLPLSTKKKINWLLQIIGQYPCLDNWRKPWKGMCTKVFSTTYVKKVISSPFSPDAPKAIQLLSSYYTHITHL